MGYFFAARTRGEHEECFDVFVGKHGWFQSGLLTITVGTNRGGPDHDSFGKKN
jgi:hypothetical protein